MKKLYILFLLPFFGLNAQIESTWKLAPQAGALAVGPDATNLTWWSNSSGDVTTRACLFDDSVKFAPGGTMTHYMDGNTWLEGWQGVSQDGCGTPVAPHNGGQATYIFDAAAGTLTVNGLGAHLGLAKVTNTGELTSPANAVSSITYNVAFSNGGNTMTLGINFGPGYWQFIYQKTQIVQAATPLITFQVNMNNYTGPAFTNVYVSGTFNNWSGNANPMTDANLDGIWEVTLPINQGAIEYKFSLDNWSNSEQFAGGETCTVTNGGFTNRSYTVVGDANLGAVCYESCSVCTSDVTFHVNMSDYVGAAFTGVFINGTFNGWNGTSNPMTDANLDGIWDVTLPLPNGAIEYKFTLDGWNASEQFVGGESCTITTGGFTNRAYTVAGVADLGVVCYQACADCIGGLNENVASTFTLMPNPAQTSFNIVSAEKITEIELVDLSGKSVRKVTGTTNVNVADLVQGMYTVIVRSENGTSTSRVIVE
ncbi:MAG: hypothetical protein RIS20_1030 [Bacteroidota bacterium]|jgi:hypothetical protein